MKKITLAILFGLISNMTFAQELIEPSPVKWYSLAEAQELQKTQPRPWLVDVYTDWCGWCKHMMKTTFASDGIAKHINDNFYAIRFDAEQKDSIIFRDTVYYNTSEGNRPPHDFAKRIMNNRMSYPTIVYMDIDWTFQPIPGYQDVRQIEPLLVYYANRLNKYVDFFRFQSYFQYTFDSLYSEQIEKNTIKTDTLGKVNWLTFEEAQAKMKTEKKLLLVDIYTNWCHLCKIMKQTTYKNKVIADYINNEFYPVRFNAASQDTIQAFGQAFPPTGVNSPHQLTYALLQKNLLFPSVLFIDGNQVVSKNQAYLPPEILEILMVYYNENHYKSISYPDFTKEYKSKIK